VRTTSPTSENKAAVADGADQRRREESMSKMSSPPLLLACAPPPPLTLIRVCSRGNLPRHRGRVHFPGQSDRFLSGWIELKTLQGLTEHNFCSRLGLNPSKDVPRGSVHDPGREWAKRTSPTWVEGRGWIRPKGGKMQEESGRRQDTKGVTHSCKKRPINIGRDNIAEMGICISLVWYLY
jgi:hypothetical protein